MKILKTEVDIGDKVIIEEKYNEDRHTLKHNRLYLGFISMLDDSGNLALYSKKLINPKTLDMLRLRDFFKIFYNIGIMNFGNMNQVILHESQIKSIRVLK